MTDYALGSTEYIPLQLFLAGTATPATGKTVPLQISKNCGVFGNPSAGVTNATEIGLGWYYFAPSSTDTGTLGPLIIQGTCAGCDNVNISHSVIPATNGRLSALPGTACTGNASLITSGTGTDQVSNASGIVTANSNGDFTTTMKTSLNTAAQTILTTTSGVETNLTVQGALRLSVAALAGKLSGAGTTTVTIRDTNDTVNRIVATVDANGNRSLVTLTD